VCLLASPFVVKAAEVSSSWIVYHSWNPQQEFRRRGTISWRVSVNGEDTNTNNDSDDGFEMINDDELSPEDIQALLEYGWYHVKLVSSNGDDKNDSVLSTVPACHVRRANFKDQFEITIPRSKSMQNQQEDGVTSLAYTPLISPLAPKTCETYLQEFQENKESDSRNDKRAFASKVMVQLDTPGLPIRAVLPQAKPPPGLTFLKRPKTPRSKQDKTNGATANAGDNAEETEDEEESNKPEPVGGLYGFFQRYWYIILPMLIMNLMTAPQEPEGQQQQQQQPDGLTSSQGGQASAAAQGRSARRGKRS
jgi:hypothetical protein